MRQTFRRCAWPAEAAIWAGDNSSLFDGVRFQAFGLLGEECFKPFANVGVGLHGHGKQAFGKQSIGCGHVVDAGNAGDNGKICGGRMSGNLRCQRLGFGEPLTCAYNFVAKPKSRPRCAS